MLKGIKEIHSRNARLILGTLIHAGLEAAAFMLAYNTYKEIVTSLYGKYFLTHAVKAEIKAAFPWAILIFAILYVICSIRYEKKVYLTARRYGIIFISLAVITSSIFLSKGYHVVVVLNFSLIYLAIFLCVWAGIEYVLSDSLAAPDGIMTLLLPPILSKPLINNIPRIRDYLKEKPSAPFIIGFIALLMICAFLLIFKVEKAAEQIANIAYFSLVIGVGIEVYQMIKHGNVDNEKED